MIIKTKIVATVGPACREPAELARLAKAGVDVFRLNFSHGTVAEHTEALRNIRQVSADLGEPLAVLADLCGPKIRVRGIRGGSVLLPTGAELAIVRKTVDRSAHRISTTVPELIDDVRRGQRILLDDGKIELKIIDRRPPDEIICQVVAGGILASGKGVNLPGTKLSVPVPTEKDRTDAEWIARHDIDYVAVSFVQRAADVSALRKILKAGRSDARIIAKIEKPQALKNIDAIIDSADGVLVARGDLGVEMDLAEVPLVQKRLVGLCGRAGKCCIIATQMLESMTERSTPTRAEVSDVANAVLDGADAVMLSGETAIGKYPEKAVRMMDRIAKRVERYLAETSNRAHAEAPLRSDSTATASRPGAEPLLAVARAVRTVVHSQNVRAVVAFTLSGATARMLSKMRLAVPILALSPSQRAVQQMCLIYGVQGIAADVPEHTRDVLAVAAKQVRRLRWARKGQKIVVVSGRPLGKSGKTNTLVVHTV